MPQLHITPDVHIEWEHPTLEVKRHRETINRGYRSSVIAVGGSHDDLSSLAYCLALQGQVGQNYHF